jgi:hypothetical protein
MLRLVLGGHSRAPQPYGPRLCAKHQSLRGSRCRHAVRPSPALSVSHRAAAGPRRTQPRSAALRTATVCEAPVAAGQPLSPRRETLPRPLRISPCCGWSSADTAALHSLTDRDCVRSTSRCGAAVVTTPRDHPPPSPYLTVLRLVPGGHSRAPQPYGPRLCMCRPPLPVVPKGDWNYFPIVRTTRNRALPLIMRS